MAEEVQESSTTEIAMDGDVTNKMHKAKRQGEFFFIALHFQPRITRNDS